MLSGAYRLIARGGIAVEDRNLQLRLQYPDEPGYHRRFPRTDSSHDVDRSYSVRFEKRPVFCRDSRVRLKKIMFELNVVRLFGNGDDNVGRI